MFPAHWGHWACWPWQCFLMHHSCAYAHSLPLLPCLLLTFPRMSEKSLQLYFIFIVMIQIISSVLICFMKDQHFWSRSPTHTWKGGLRLYHPLKKNHVFPGMCRTAKSCLLPCQGACNSVCTAVHFCRNHVVEFSGWFDYKGIQSVIQATLCGTPLTSPHAPSGLQAVGKSREPC